MMFHSITIHRSGGLVYALCLALGLPSELALNHLRSIRKRGSTDNKLKLDVMVTEGGRSFKAQIDSIYAELKVHDRDYILSSKLVRYNVIPIWE